MSSDSGVGDGLLVVDKPGGWTSHDVVARVRRLAGTRRVGHAGTLDPMATGVLVIGVNRATRLLGHLALGSKTYDATIRLGASSSTDDAEGELHGDAAEAAAALDEAAILAAMGALTGELQQVPSAVSAVKVDGQRAYARVRAGEQVELKPRPVTVARFDLIHRRGADLDVTVECSSGTYVRALARDLGAALGVGGHLTALRRTRVGGFGLDRARTLEQLEGGLELIDLAAAARQSFPARELDADEARRLGFGQQLDAPERRPGPVAAFDPDGRLVALVDEESGHTRVLAGFTG